MAKNMGSNARDGLRRQIRQAMHARSRPFGRPRRWHAGIIGRGGKHQHASVAVKRQDRGGLRRRQVRTRSGSGDIHPA